MVKVNLKKQLGKRVAELRKVQDLSQEKFAELLDLSITSLSQIETGTNFPRAETIEKIADILKANITDLFNFSPGNLEELSRDLIRKIKFIKKDKTKLLAIYTFVQRLL